MLRKSKTLDSLMTPTRQGILSASLLHSSKWWYLSELASSMGVRPSTLQRDIDGLAAAGILTRRVEGRRVYVKANEDSPVFSELRGLFEKTAGTVPVLSQMLFKHRDRVRFGMIHGSTARAEDAAHSDVDVLLIGDISLFDLVPALRRAESMLGRQVNPTIFTEREFMKKVEAKNHFLLTVLREKKIMLKGAEDELAAIVSQAKAPRSRHQ